MSRYSSLTVNYKKLALTSLRKNLFNFSIGIVGFAFVSFYLISLLLQNPYLFQKPIQEKTKTAVKQTLPNANTLKSVNNSFPNDTQGQTSSISTKKVINTKNTYTVKEGDYLWKIAEESYGDGMMMYTIMKANNLKDLNDVVIGKVLKIPRK